MSTNPANATATRGWPLRFQQAPSSWLSTLIFNAKAITAVGEALPFPYVRGVFGTAVFMLEAVEVCVKLFGRKCGLSCSQKVQNNQDELKELCTDTVDIITVVRDRISSHRDTAALQFKVQCEELDRYDLDPFVTTISSCLSLAFCKMS
jgi:hypothetical protein